jgi:hypothetical protein
MRYLLAFFAVTAPAWAADLTGTWQFVGDVSGNPVELECALKQDGTKLSGTCKSPLASNIPVAGEVSDKKVTFSYSVDYQGATYTLQYTGKVDEAGTGLTGGIEVAGAGGTFSAKKI